MRPEFIAAGTEKGNIHVTTDMGETWTNVTQNGLPTRYITDIEFSLEKEETFYITLSGYYTSHVYKTTNLGKTWISISDQLPDISANAIVIHPDNENNLLLEQTLVFLPHIMAEHHGFHLEPNSPILQCSTWVFMKDAALQMIPCL